MGICTDLAGMALGVRMSERTEESSAPDAQSTSGGNRPKTGGDWLLAAAPSTRQARAQWTDTGAAWLLPGARFAAVTIPARTLHEAVGRSGPRECAPHLARALDGPLFCRPAEFGPDAGYTALLPAREHVMWRRPGTVVRSPRALLLVPAPDVWEPVTDGPWWVVPPDEVGTLCTPTRLLALLAEGNRNA